MTPRVVVVDPDTEHISRCRRMLASAGYDVFATSDVVSARDASSGAAAVLVDVDLGWDSLASLRSAADAGGAAVFGMTEVFVGELNRALAVHHDGLADLFTKPVDEGSLLGWMSRVAPVSRRVAQPTPAASAAVTAAEVASRVDTGLASPPPPGDRLVARAGGMPWEASAEPAAAPALAPAAAAPPITQPIGAGVAMPAAASVNRLDVRSVDDEGSFEEHALASVLASLAYRQVTGSLMLQSGDAKRMVTLVGGFPVAARSSTDATTVEQKLVADGIVRADQIDAAQRFAQSRAMNVGDALLALGVLDPDDLLAIRAALLEQLTVDAFDWTDGVYSFRAAAAPAGTPEPFVGPMELIWAGVGRFVSAEVLRLDLRRVLGRRLVRAGDVGALEGLSFSRSQQELVDSLSRTGGATLASNAGEALLRAAYLLVATGIARPEA